MAFSGTDAFTQNMGPAGSLKKKGPKFEICYPSGAKTKIF